MLSYTYFGTNNLDKAIAFYSAALAPLGMKRCVTDDAEWDRIAAGWGTYEDGGARELAFWIGKPYDQQPASVGNGSMVAFSACSWKAIDNFHAGLLCRVRTRSRRQQDRCRLSWLYRTAVTLRLSMKNPKWASAHVSPRIGVSPIERYGRLAACAAGDENQLTSPRPCLDRPQGSHR
jgi:hypothetical protein